MPMAIDLFDYSNGLGDDSPIWGLQIFNDKKYDNVGHNWNLEKYIIQDWRTKALVVGDIWFQFKHFISNWIKRNIQNSDFKLFFSKFN
jgi:hypothetical protein